MLHRIACRSHTDRRRSLVELAGSLSVDRHAMSRANLPHRAQDDRLHLHALARLCTICQTTDLLTRLRAAEGAREISAAACACEGEVVKRMQTGAGIRR